MARPQRAKTPQQPKGQKQQGQKMPQSAPAGRKFQGKMAGLEDTPKKAQGTPKPGDKRKLDTMLASQKRGKGTPKTANSKPNTPAAMAKKGNSSPAKQPQTPQIFKPQTPRGKKTPQAKKTPQTKTPASAGKGGKKTPQPVEEDDEDDDEDDDDDDEDDIGGLEMGSDDDSEGEDMDEDDEDEEESKALSPKKRVATIGRATENDEEDDDSDMEDDDDEDDGGGFSENDILQKLKELREASNKQEKKQPVANKQKQQKDSKAQKQPQSPTKQKQAPQQPQSPTKQSPTKAKPLTEKQGQEQPPSPTKQKAKEEPGQLSKAAAAASNSGDRDKRTLFVKNLPPTVSPSEIRALSKDIKEVRFRITVRAKRREKKKMGYAFVEFASEAMAEKNYKALQGAKIGSCEVAVDYVGEKSNHQAGKPKAKQEVGNPDPLRLYVTGFGSDLKEADLHKLFPKAQGITVPRRKKDKSPVGFAFIGFATEQQCKTAHDKSQNAKLQGHSLVVLYAKKLASDAQKKDPKLNQKKDSEKTAQPPAKKAKLEDSDDDDEDDDNDDDDDDDDEDDSAEDDEDDEDEDDIAGEDEDDDDEDEDDDDDDDDE